MWEGVAVGGIAEVTTLDASRGSRPDRGASAFEEFYRDEYPAVLRLAFVMSGRWAIAEEVTQEAFMRALDRWDDRGLERPEAWVRTVAVNLARSRFRRVAAEVRALARLDRRSPSAAPDVPLEMTAFWAAVRSLPRRQAQAVALYYVEDRSVLDVAELMGCAEGTAKALLHQARAKLADIIDPDGGGAA